MRGKAAADGDTRTAPNGYHYTRVRGHWVLTHRLTMEKHLGRPLRAGEQVRFKPEASRYKDFNNYKKLMVVEVKEKSKASRKAVLQAKIEELQAQLEDLE